MCQCAGYGRWVWNWALNFKQKAYQEDIKLNKSQLEIISITSLSPPSTLSSPAPLYIAMPTNL
ncbi:MAG: helix-turn-helix domain-containing protein [Xenococcaceae cyanobacterium MO_188.B32]|nr:helix-turn-helix domain-containing protein [Xenococcaceae cyanobacterium MO_188.B32]